jgi:putative transposase
MKNPPRTSRRMSSTALFRYSVLSQVEAMVLGGEPVGTAVRVVAKREHVDLSGQSAHVTVRTLQRWRAAWMVGGLSALEPKDRGRTQTSEAMPDDLIAFILDEKKRDPRASSPQLISRARVRGVIREDLPVDRTTVWRLCMRTGLPTRVGTDKREADTRRWRYPHRMQCVLCDGKHFRAGPTRAKRVALFFLDDATRYGLDVIVGPSESTDLFLHGLFGLVQRYGLMDLVYVDRGPGFRSDDTVSVVVQGLQAWHIHGKSRYPQGHGAIERFNRTAQSDVLRSLPGAIDVDADCAALTLRLRH